MPACLPACLLACLPACLPAPPPGRSGPVACFLYCSVDDHDNNAPSTATSISTLICFRDTNYRFVRSMKTARHWIILLHYQATILFSNTTTVIRSINSIYKLVSNTIISIIFSCLRIFHWIFVFWMSRVSTYFLFKSFDSIIAGFDIIDYSTYLLYITYCVSRWNCNVKNWIIQGQLRMARMLCILCKIYNIIKAFE